MGYYINPKSGSKLEFLEQFGVEITLDLAKKMPIEAIRDDVLVVLVNNKDFDAAGIAWCDRERDVFLSENDIRPKRYFSVPLSVLDGDAGLGDDFPVRYRKML